MAAEAADILARQAASDRKWARLSARTDFVQPDAGAMDQDSVDRKDSK
ncbi:hypothetical protein [Nocardia stercoris]|nr:hypothetical protein [Nocardia stercoris]